MLASKGDRDGLGGRAGDQGHRKACSGSLLAWYGRAFYAALAGESARCVPARENGAIWRARSAFAQPSKGHPANARLLRRQPAAPQHWANPRKLLIRCCCGNSCPANTDRRSVRHPRPAPAHKASVASFVLEGYRTEQVGAALNREGIAVRSGHHLRAADPAPLRPGSHGASLAGVLQHLRGGGLLVTTVRRLTAHKGRLDL